jgi:hypothetical protein
VSKQGIGRLKPTLHTGTKKLKVSIDGTMTTSAFGVSYTTTSTRRDIVLSQMATSPQISPDGLTQPSRSAAAVRDAEIRIKIADCRSRTPRRARSSCRGPRVERRHEPRPALFVYWTDSTFRTTGGSCVGLPLDLFTARGAAPWSASATVLARGPAQPRAKSVSD